MHPLFATRWALPFYLLTWAGLSVVPAVALDGAPPLARQLLALAATWGFVLLCLPGYYLCRALPLGTRGLVRVLGVQAAVTFVWALVFCLEFELLAQLLTLLPNCDRLPEVVALR